ncbi:hypothetical protein BC831DRAFT_517022 [Entophlyctis helioformis]|nr:hypothetical protein BC831DRAFT_517022 [Entophlyctis helioformis]
MSKMPISFMVVSLRFINPAPLVERVLRLFLWQPAKGIHSLLQKLAAHLCSYEATQIRFKRYQGRVHDLARRHAIEEAAKNPTLSSIDSQLHLVESFAAAGVAALTADELKFAIVCIRKREKTSFIDALADPTLVDLVAHIAHLAPKLLNDLRKFGDLASVVGQFFEAVRKSLAILERYAVYKKHRSSMETRSHTDHASSSTGGANTLVDPAFLGDDLYDAQFDALSREIVSDIETAWRGFLEALYPVLHNIGKAAAAGGVVDSIILRMVDWLMNGLMTNLQFGDEDEEDESDNDVPHGVVTAASKLKPMDPVTISSTHGHSSVSLNADARQSTASTVADAESLTAHGPSASKASGTTAYPVPSRDTTRRNVRLDRVLAMLSQDETEALWKEVDAMMDMALSGLDQRLWPDFPLMNGKVAEQFVVEIIKDLNE